MKRYLLAIAVLIVAALAAAGVYATKLVRPEPVPASVLALEDAMALSDLIAIVHVDVAHASAIERTFMRVVDPDALASGDSLVSQLWRRGLAPDEMIDHAVAAFAPGETAATVGAVVGRFPVSEIRAALESEAEVEERDGLWFLTREDIDTCERSDPIALDLRPERAIFGTPELVRTVAERLDAGAAAEVDLSEWRTFRRGQTASLALLLPDRMAEGVGHPIARVVAARASEGLDGVRTAYLGAAFTAWPPGALVQAQLESEDTAWAGATAQTFASWKREFGAENAEKLPSLANLLARLELAADTRALHATLALDRGVGDEIGRVFSEGIQAAFGGTEMASGDVGEESVLEPGELDRFVAVLDPASLPPANPAENVFAGPEQQAVTGPFAVRIASRRVRSDRDGAIELEIAADGSRIPNLQQDGHYTDDAAPLTLAVTSVRDASGRQLLAEEHCGRDRNSLAAALRAGSDMEFEGGEIVKVAPTWTGEKRVRLAAGAGVDDVRLVEGHVALRLPTHVETRRVTPFTGEVVELDGVRIAFGDVDEENADTVAYELSGAMDRVLALRALNAAGQYLASSSVSSATHGLRPGKAVSQSFHGRVAGVELLLATEVAELRYPFRIEDARAQFADWTYEQAVAEPQSRRDFRRAVAGISIDDVCAADRQPVAAPPFRLCVGEPHKTWGGLAAPVQIFAPKVRALEANLSGIEVALDRVAIRDDQGLTHVVESGTSQFASPSPSWQKPTLEEELWLQAPLAEDGPTGDLVGIEGRVVHRLPTSLHALAMDVSRLGSSIEYSNGFGMRFVEVGAGKLHFELRGDRHAIVQLVVRDAAGEALPTRNVSVDTVDDSQAALFAAVTGTPPNSDEDPDPRPLHRASLEVAAPEGRRPMQLEVVYALGIDEKTTRFQARLGEAAVDLAGLRQP